MPSTQLPFGTSVEAVRATMTLRRQNHLQITIIISHLSRNQYTNKVAWNHRSMGADSTPARLYSAPQQRVKK
eukprot:35007-Eustigmatos_ZCMA.PRE.1